MTGTVATRRSPARSVLGFLKRSWDRRGAAVLTVVGFALLVSACDERNLMPSPDANTNGGGVDGGVVCGLPFDVGPCDAAFQVWAFVGGDCVQQTYGGCQGNGNRFATLEECVATCSSQTPKTGACLPNRIEREICLACGLAGGCAKAATLCALICVENQQDTGCPASIPFCYDNVCHYTAGCI